jgi:hypothetical protein
MTHAVVRQCKYSSDFQISYTICIVSCQFLTTKTFFWPQFLSMCSDFLFTSKTWFFGRKFCHFPVTHPFGFFLTLCSVWNRTTGSKYKKYFSLLLDGNGNQNWVFVTEIETKESSRFFLKMMIKSFHFMIAQRDIFMTVISYCCCSKICCCFSWW